MKRFLDYSGLEQVLAKIKAAIAKLGGGLTYKGVVDNVDKLPIISASSSAVGWVYTIREAGQTTSAFAEGEGTLFEDFTQVAVIYDSTTGFKYTILGTIFEDTVNVVFGDTPPTVSSECVWIYTGSTLLDTYTIAKFNKYLNPYTSYLFEKNASGGYTRSTDTQMQETKSYYRASALRYKGDIYYTTGGGKWDLISHGSGYIEDIETVSTAQIDTIFEQLFKNA